jgi:Ala-tRNA(Pro) deacylase
MGVPETVKDFLSAREVEFQLIEHKRSVTTLQAARSASVPPAWTAKAIVVEDGEKLLLAIIPASHRLDLQALGDAIGHPVFLVEEADFSLLFRDCSKGAVPPLAGAYGVEAVIDESLIGKPHLYLECGDHEHLIHLNHDQFVRLYERSQRAQISMTM